MKAEIVKQVANVVATAGGDIAEHLAPVFIAAIQADRFLPRHIVNVTATVAVIGMVLDHLPWSKSPNDDMFECETQLLVSPTLAALQ